MSRRRVAWKETARYGLAAVAVAVIIMALAVESMPLGSATSPGFTTVQLGSSPYETSQPGNGILNIYLTDAPPSGPAFSYLLVNVSSLDLAFQGNIAPGTNSSTASNYSLAVPPSVGMNVNLSSLQGQSLALGGTSLPAGSISSTVINVSGARAFYNDGSTAQLKVFADGKLTVPLQYSLQANGVTNLTLDLTPNSIKTTQGGVLAPVILATAVEKGQSGTTTHTVTVTESVPATTTTITKTQTLTSETTLTTTVIHPSTTTQTLTTSAIVTTTLTTPATSTQTVTSTSTLPPATSTTTETSTSTVTTPTTTTQTVTSISTLPPTTTTTTATETSTTTETDTATSTVTAPTTTTHTVTSTTTLPPTTTTTTATSTATTTKTSTATTTSTATATQTATTTTTATATQTSTTTTTTTATQTSTTTKTSTTTTTSTATQTSTTTVTSTTTTTVTKTTRTFSGAVGPGAALASAGGSAAPWMAPTLALGMLVATGVGSLALPRFRRSATR